MFNNVLACCWLSGSAFCTAADVVFFFFFPPTGCFVFFLAFAGATVVPVAERDLFFVVCERVLYLKIAGLSLFLFLFLFFIFFEICLDEDQLCFCWLRLGSAREFVRTWSSPCCRSSFCSASRPLLNCWRLTFLIAVEDESSRFSNEVWGFRTQTSFSTEKPNFLLSTFKFLRLFSLHFPTYAYAGRLFFLFLPLLHSSCIYS